ncbi:hypothetical protein K435DRAFT_328938 [Dendrothele bispora CBS 962.96]|uniref:Chaperone DnaJ C-terminal domain-containing protein n=1 Tax=Dendrothele bispora (strain CBS 962.96) TaxID=1314807 RepID=A0A4V4HIM9_DENBC|nr:hypothetical protein K435DRAFT_328938 [Dendrothele bispora CBS 962.96]
MILFDFDTKPNGVADYSMKAAAWNPDRHIEDKNHATAKFIEIKNAYLMLMHELHPEEASTPIRQNPPRFSGDHSPTRTTRPPLRRATTTHDLVSAARSSESSPNSNPSPNSNSIPSPNSHPNPNPNRSYFDSHPPSTRISVDNVPLPIRPPFHTRNSSNSVGSLVSSRQSSLESVTTAPSSPTFTFQNLPKDFEPVPSHAPTTPSIIDVLNKTSPCVSVNPSMASKQCDTMSPAGSRDSRTKPSVPIIKSPFNPHKKEDQKPSKQVSYDRIPSYGPINSARGLGTSKEWKYTLTLSLEELFRGKLCRFLITRHLLNGTMEDAFLEVDVPPGCEAGRKITCYNVGHEHHPSRYQDIVFVIAESDHDRFLRVDQDLVLECKIPWTESLEKQDGRLCIPAINGQNLSMKVSCPKRRKLTGTEVITGAGMPVMHKGIVIGRGNLIVQ